MTTGKGLGRVPLISKVSNIFKNKASSEVIRPLIPLDISPVLCAKNVFFEFKPFIKPLNP